jgi:hypothetical protein
MRRLTLTLGVLALSACNCNAKPTTKTKPVVTVIVPGGQSVTENDTAFGFDDACLANPAIAPVSKDITVHNDGTAPLKLISAELTGPSKASFKITSTLPDGVAFGGEAKITIAFAPTATGNQSATLVLTTDDPVKPVVNVRMTGTGSSRAQQPTFATACDFTDGGPSDFPTCRGIDFPDTGVGATTTLPIHVTNQGCPPLHITDIAIYDSAHIGVDPQRAFKFHGTAPTAANPLVIQGGQALDVLVDFTPFTPNDTVLAVGLLTTDGVGNNQDSQPLPDGGTVGASQIAVSLSGTGVAALAAIVPSACNYNNASDNCHPTTESDGTIQGAFVVHNAGGAPLDITDFKLDDQTGTFTFLTSSQPTHFTVPASGDYPFTVVYHPLNGYLQTVIRASWASGTVVAQITGGSPPVIGTSPATVLEFGNEVTSDPVPYQAARTLDILNTGAGVLTVKHIDILNLDGDVDAGCPFSVSPAQTLPFTVAAVTGSKTIGLVHTPTALGGESNCQLYLRSDDPSWPDPGYSVLLHAFTYVDCKPFAYISPSTSLTVSFADGGATVYVSGANSFDPGVGEPRSQSSDCPNGRSQGIVKYSWTLGYDPSVTPTTSLSATGGTCTSTSAGGGCVALSAATPDLTIAFDPVFFTNYSLKLKVTDGTDGGGFVSPTADTLTIVTSP